MCHSRYVGGRQNEGGSTEWRSRGLMVGFREHPPDIDAPEALPFPSMLIPTDGSALNPSVPSAYCESRKCKNGMGKRIE